MIRILFLALSVTACAAEAATMLLTEVQGDVRAEGVADALAAVRELPARTGLRLGAGARAVIAYVEDAREFELRGPGHYRLAPATPRAIDGEPPLMRELPASYRSVRLDPARLKQLGVVMRGGDSDTLSPHGLLVEPPAALTWSTRTVLPPYTVTLADYAGNMVLQETTDGTQLALPDNALREGMRYRWSVEGQGSDGEHHIRATTFALPTAELRALLLELSRSAAETTARRALYDSVLNSLATSTGDAVVLAKKTDCRGAPGGSAAGGCVPGR